MSESTDTEEVRLNAGCDQAWAELDARLADIVRIADHGPADARDVLVVRMCMHFLAAELYRRRHYREKE